MGKSHTCLTGCFPVFIVHKTKYGMNHRVGPSKMKFVQLKEGRYVYLLASLKVNKNSEREGR